MTEPCAVMAKAPAAFAVSARQASRGKASTSLSRRCSAKGRRLFKPRIRGALTLGTDLGDRLRDARAMGVRRRGNKKAICWPFEKPSDGLEPSTPSLPSWNQVGKRGHARVTAGTKA